MLKSFLPTNRASWLLLAALLCCVLEGAVRKWAVGDSSNIGRVAYFSKDLALIAIAALGVPVANRLSGAARQFLVAGMLLTALGVATSAASGISPIGAILSTRTFFVLPFAAYMAGQSLPSDSLKKAALWISLLALPSAVLGSMQFYAPATSRLNQYSTESKYIATTGFNERVRATGTFSYITGFSNFATLAVWGGIVTLTLAANSQERVLGAAGIGAGFICTFATVSRSSILASSVLVAVWAVFGGGLTTKLRHAAIITGVLCFGLFISDRRDEFAEIASAVKTRSETASDGLVERFAYQYLAPVYAINLAPLGAGYGMEQAGRGAIEGAVREGSAFESPWGRIVMETGILGLIGSIVICGVFFAPSWTLYSHSTSSEQRTVIAVTTAAALGFAVVGYQFNHVTSFFFWFLCAVLLAAGRESPEDNWQPHLMPRELDLDYFPVAADYGVESRSHRS